MVPSASLFHPTACIHPSARIAAGVRVGPYCVVGRDVSIEAGVVLHSHVVIGGRTHVGASTQIFPFVSIGHPAQHLQYKGTEGRIRIGQNVTIREHVTINAGMSEENDYLTTVGDRTSLFIGSHVAHDVHVGQRVTIINNVLLGGHVKIEDEVVVSGGAAVHPFCRVGKGAFVGGLTGVTRDVIPYGYVFGNPACMVGLNIVGMRRRGTGRGAIQALRDAYKAIFYGKDGFFKDRVSRVLAAYGHVPEVADVVDFLQKGGVRRPVCYPRYRARSGDFYFTDSCGEGVVESAHQFEGRL